MDERTTQFVSYVYDTVLKPYPNVKKNIQVLTPGFLSNFIYGFLKTSEDVIHSTENTYLNIHSNDWMEQPEMVVQLCIALKDYIYATKPDIETITMSFYNTKEIYHLVIQTTIGGNRIYENLNKNIQIKPFNLDKMRATIMQTIQEWKLTLINKRFSPKKLSTPTSKETCDGFYILQQGTDLTCWSNTVINSFLISKNMRRIAITYFNRYKKNQIDTLPLEKQQAFYNPEMICVLPKTLMTDTAERFSIMQFIYNAICFYDKTIQGNNNPQLQWNRQLAKTFKETHKSVLSNISQVFKDGGIGFVLWAIKGFLKNIYGEPDYKMKVMEDVSYASFVNGNTSIPSNVEIVLTNTVSSFPIKKEVLQNGQRYVLDHVAIFLYGLTSLHYLAGVLCNGIPYILDTGLVKVREVNWVDGDFSLIKEKYKTGSIRVSYACYIKDMHYDEEPEINCNTSRNVIKTYEVKQALAALPPISLRGGRRVRFKQ